MKIQTKAINYNYNAINKFAKSSIAEGFALLIIKYNENVPFEIAQYDLNLYFQKRCDQNWQYIAFHPCYFESETHIMIKNIDKNIDVVFLVCNKTNEIDKNKLLRKLYAFASKYKCSDSYVKYVKVMKCENVVEMIYRIIDYKSRKLINSLKAKGYEL